MMEDFYIKGTHTIPTIEFNLNGVCSIVGNSIPDGLDEIYKKATLSLNNIVASGVKIDFTFNMDYFNTMTQRYMYELLEILTTAKEKTVKWIYSPDDEDILEMGETYRDTFKDLKIKLVKK